MNRAAQAGAMVAATATAEPEAPPEEPRHRAARERLAATLREDQTGLDQRVLDAIGSVPRHLFVPAHLRHAAYEDRALPIGHDQTISAPHMVAIMCSVLDVHPGDRVLEVGTGSGYHAAVLAVLAGPQGRVVTVETLPALAYQAQRDLERAGYAERVEVRVGDGADGAEDAAPFDRVSIAAATPDVPPRILEQVRPGGMVVAPLGTRQAILTRLERSEQGWTRTEHGLCVFVPLTGPSGRPRGGNGGGPGYA
jgi:protein-L-isoaspartate(D-aspartate) O-methyltransferase